jgi:hypothetical protein
MTKYVRDDYEYGECPDCRKAIPHTAVEGDQCSECGCVFFAKQDSTNDIQLDDNTDDGEALASAGWGSDEDYGVYDSNNY